MRRYRPLSRAGVVGNIALIALTGAVAFFFGLQQLTFPVVLANVLLAVTLAGLLGFLGSGWAMLGLAVAFFGGPLATEFLLVGAQLSIQTWFMSLIAGWTLGALARRHVDRGLPGRDRASGPALQWWVRGRRCVQNSPTLAQVEAKVRALDGRERTLVCVIDRDRQINICGDAAREVIVFRTEDVTDGERWELPLGGPVDASDVVEIAMGNVSAPVARGLTVDVEAALKIVEAFLAKKRVDSGAGTWRGGEVLTVRPSLP
ncbi:Imm1 family immunity protein [Curtobacterium poinsettiae]|uniref:Imm1 family immunity protein n=1 Tax=Curtobacterium poinsettiae TaxID=159612 RepID=UPI00217EB4D8|nr:Imm1 family immunity protein [Curtobacterium flaccumfaciens]MCS6579524.1 Imm1 family immunity protein [Curtobacterium flaccumfaciens]